ncbi:MAG: sigma-70 family RNA polymerase sigma factor [Planctomycetaceae bacterium]
MESDRALLARIRTGDRQALAILYERYAHFVWRYVSNRLRGDEHTSRDVMSETFLAAIRGLRVADGEIESVSGWLATIARHKLADHHRQKTPEQLGHTDGLPARVDESEASNNAGARHDEIDEILSRLPDDERVVLEWKYLEDLSVREIAGRLGRTERAVEGLLFRARHAFRRFYSVKTADP